MLHSPNLAYMNMAAMACARLRTEFQVDNAETDIIDLRVGDTIGNGEGVLRSDSVRPTVITTYLRQR